MAGSTHSASSLKKTLIAVVLASAVTMPGLPAWAETLSNTNPPLATSASKTTTKLATVYVELAGSPQNADALIAGLRTGSSITLVASIDSANPLAPPATFTPATGKLSIGNINIALSLAKQGITNPTPAQLAAALNGGTISTANGTVTMTGILTQRQSGMGWGQIANAMGVKLGALVSASKTDKAGNKGADADDGKATKADVEHGKSASAHSNASGNSGGNSSHGGGGNSGSSGGGHGK